MNELASQSRKIFCEIMDLQTEDEQDRFLEAQCSDHPEIEPRIRALLAAYRSSDKFLRGSVESTNATDALGSSGELIVTQIGHYRLVEEIGEGGFDVVYRAEQQEPIRRHVALKLIKPCMDTRQVVARFEHERQALAMMDHLNIARVLDGGATDNGRPFFVMELVLGRPITGYCDEELLGLIAANIFKSLYEPNQLLVEFKSFVDQPIDLSPIQDLNPTFDKTPVVDRYGTLLLNGHFKTKPSQLSFDLGYSNERNTWKLTMISVNLK